MARYNWNIEVSRKVLLEKELNIIGIGSSETVGGKKFIVMSINYSSGFKSVVDKLLVIFSLSLINSGL